ncbi:hypothetical protein FRC09_003104 [Ceratobasidium sp. 395]|nr:hypothetical protein FRC09_003104 [Ceratobasidium sp. 395]
MQQPPTDQPALRLRAHQGRPKVQAADLDTAAGTELDRDAPVWKVYVQETDMADKEMCDDWNRFIIESMKKLQPDPTEQSAATLLNISRTLVAMSNGQSVPLSALPDPGSPQFTAPPGSLLVNTLWLSSLTISVGVSLIAMLAKKWCHVFLSARSGPYHEQARRRQKRWDAIVWWRMRGVMDVLPLLMHLALALFAIGLVVYLWDINMQIAVTIAIVAIAFGVAYGAATVLPVVFDACPFGTVLSEPLKPFAVLGARILTAVVWFFLFLLRFLRYVLCSIVSPSERLKDILTTAGHWLDDVDERVRRFAFRYHERVDDKPADEELAMDTVTSSILAWLIQNTENSDHVNLTLQAISAASIELPMAPLRIIKAEEVAFQQLEKYVPTFGQSAFISPTSSPQEVSLLCRALSHLLVSDSHSNYVEDRWYDGHSGFGDYSAAKEILKAHASLVHCNYPDPSLNPNTFILHASALMPAYHWPPNQEYLLHEAVTEMLSVIRRHNEQALTLRPQALSAFATGCAHYLVTHISKNDHGETVQQLIYALLRLYFAAETGATSLRYTIAVTLASSAAAARVYDQVPGILLSDDSRYTTNYGARLFAKYVHQGAELAHRPSPTTRKLLYFGLFGVSHLLPFTSVADELMTMLQTMDEDCRGDDAISLKTVPRRLTWGQLRLQAGMLYLKKVPELNGLLDAEVALAEYLDRLVLGLGPVRLEAGPDQVMWDATISAVQEALAQ